MILFFKNMGFSIGICLLFFITVCGFFPDSIHADQLNSSGVNYNAQRDFKAVAKAFQGTAAAIVDGKPVLGYAWNYDTAAEASEAAKAYCAEQIGASSGSVHCKVIRLGEMPVYDAFKFDILLRQYEDRVTQQLEDTLVKTGHRDVITQLSTIYQKIGRYERSETLLIGLALQGEHLAQNAIAYHWAELSKNLDQALSFAASAIAQNPSFFSYHDTKALVLFRLHRIEEAVETSKHAVTLNAHPIALDHYGDMLWFSGQKEAAIRQWKKAVEKSHNILFVQRLNLKIKNGATRDFVFE